MATKIDSLSVFFPAYNEEKNIEKTVKSAIKILLKTATHWEIIIINDGSKDNTARIAGNLAKGDRRIRVITHDPNRGYGASLKSGLYSSKYPWIAFTDSDGQFDFSEISMFLEEQRKTSADIVVGYYLKRQVSFLRKMNTFLWQFVVRILFGLKVRDIDCGFKLISKRVLGKIPKLESERGAFISSELLIKSQKAGFKIVEVGVHHYPRIAGKATGANLEVIVKSFVDLFRLWRKLS